MPLPNNYRCGVVRRFEYCLSGLEGDLNVTDWFERDAQALFVLYNEYMAFLE